MLELRVTTGVVAILAGGFVFALLCLNQRAQGTSWAGPALPAPARYPILPAGGGSEFALYVPGSGFSSMSVPRWDGQPAREGPGFAG